MKKGEAEKRGTQTKEGASKPYDVAELKRLRALREAQESIEWHEGVGDRTLPTAYDDHA